jgi:hypothetical protein
MSTERSSRGRGSASGDSDEKYKGKGAIFDRINDGEPGPLKCTIPLFLAALREYLSFQDSGACYYSTQLFSL